MSGAHSSETYCELSRRMALIAVGSSVWCCRLPFVLSSAGCRSQSLDSSARESPMPSRISCSASSNVISFSVAIPAASTQTARPRVSFSNSCTNRSRRIGSPIAAKCQHGAMAITSIRPQPTPAPAQPKRPVLALSWAGLDRPSRRWRGFWSSQCSRAPKISFHCSC